MSLPFVVHQLVQIKDGRLKGARGQIVDYRAEGAGVRWQVRVSGIVAGEEIDCLVWLASSSLEVAA